MAAHLAYDTELSAKQAEGVLKAALKDVNVGVSDAPPSRNARDKSPKGDALRQAMERTPKLVANDRGLVDTVVNRPPRDPGRRTCLVVAIRAVE